MSVVVVGWLTGGSCVATPAGRVAGFKVDVESPWLVPVTCAYAENILKTYNNPVFYRTIKYRQEMMDCQGCIVELGSICPCFYWTKTNMTCTSLTQSFDSSPYAHENVLKTFFTRFLNTFFNFLNVFNNLKKNNQTAWKEKPVVETGHLRMSDTVRRKKC